MAEGHWQFRYFVSHFVGADYQQPTSHWVGVMATVDIAPPSVIVGYINEGLRYYVEVRPKATLIVEDASRMTDASHQQQIVELNYAGTE
jgi:hypothetical protein